MNAGVRPQQLLRAAALIVALAAPQLTLAEPSANPSYWNRYVGVHPCSGRDQFFREPAVVAALKIALGSASERYDQHRAASGCSAIERHENFLFVDISQLHVGGYTSMILFDPATNNAYVFWLDSTVKTWNAKTYGKRPIPPTVLAKFDEEMNVTWGHVATFGVRQGDIAIVGEGKGQ